MIVVGIDGSRSALNAALWAVDEAFQRSVPLRLVYAIHPPSGRNRDRRALAHHFATAECAVRQASTAIEAVDHDVEIEAQIIQGTAVDALLEASRSAAMLAVGSLGVDRAVGRRLGSAAVGLLSRALCPVAVIGSAPRPHDRRCIVTEFDASDDAHIVLGHAMAEARLRRTALRVITAWQPATHDNHGAHPTTIGLRQAESRLERSLSRYRPMEPDLDISAVAVRGGVREYVATHAADIQLIVVGHRPDDHPALASAGCSMLVSERHGAL